MTAQIKIRRTASVLRANLKIDVYLDLEKRGEIANGQTLSLYVAPGVYHLRLVHKMQRGESRSPSVKFRLGDNETILFEGGFKAIGMWLQQQ